MKYYNVVAAKTLTEAIEITLRMREGNQIWLILSLDGNRYYRFHSQANLGQTMFRQASNMVEVNAQIRAAFNSTQPAGNLTPSVVKATQAAGNLTAGERNQRAHSLGDTHLQPDARNLRDLVDEDGHAEEFLIANWKPVHADYMSATGKSPKKAEVVVSHTPCQAGDRNPSKPRMFDGVTYSASCSSKLYQFFKANSSVKWKLYWVEKFGVAENLDEGEITENFKGLDIERLPKQIRDLISSVRASL